nr:hypothetical protein [Nitrosomonas nitrosa]
MPKIYDKDIVSSGLSEAINSIAIYRGKKIVDVEQDLAYELNGENFSPRTLKSWKNSNSIPNTIDDGAFFGLIYLGLLTEKLGLDWLTVLLNATSIPIYTPISPRLLNAYLGQAQFQGNRLSDRQIKEVESIFFEKDSTDPKGFEYIRKRGMINFEPLQVLIPLEPVAREFIRESKQIDIEGLSLFRFVEAFFHDFVYAAKNGALVRAVLVDPTSPALEMVAFRSLSKAAKEVQKQRILNTLNTLIRVNKVSGTQAVQARTLNYMPPYGITTYHHNDKDKSICQVRLYTFRTPTSDAPTIFSDPKFNPVWFKVFTQQFNLMWNESVQWDSR